MKHVKTTSGLIAFLALVAATAVLAGPIATPHEGMPTLSEDPAPAGGAKALGDPTDWLASALAGADYVVRMQADITEDNAGNGNPDQDPEDAGFDWSTTAFVHSAGASSTNLYGVTLAGVYQAYLLDPKPAYFTAMTDAADYIVAAGPSTIRSAPDISFLVDYSTLPGVADPTPYLAAAEAIWAYRVTTYGGGTATGFAEWLRDLRGISHGYPNGIIAWDLSAYVKALMKLDAAVPGPGYDNDAIAIAEVMWQDSFNDNPGFFDPDGANQGNDPADPDHLFGWYTLGVSGLIESFSATGTHTGEISTLTTLLLDSQYEDGSFSYQYGAPTDFNSRNWQSSAYASMALYNGVTPTATTLAAVRNAATWLAATQDVSGGWVYSSGSHYPEVGGECTVAAVYGWLVGGAEVGVTFDGADPVPCGTLKTATIGYTPGDATPGIRGYEVVFEVTGPADVGAIAEGSGLSGVDATQYYAMDNGDGTYTVSCAILGATDGLQTAADLFSIELTSNGSGTVALDILSVTLRDPDNTPVFAEFTGGSFVVDCDLPAAVADITAAPAHQEVVVTWSHDDVDVDHYAIFRGLVYDTTPGTSAYPEYDDLAGYTEPTRPAAYADLPDAEWEPAGTVLAGTFTFTDTIAPRGVYHYEVFAVDAATNGSLAADANDRATNYWLGDFDGDGDVDIPDINALGNSFSLTDNTTGLVDDDWDDDTFIDHTQDVGPTDSGSPFGIPTTDNRIQFEDLIIVAMNFGEVAAKSLPTLDTQVQLAWTPLDAGRWALDLIDGQGLRGLHITAPAAVTGVQLGELAQLQDAPMFLRNVGQAMDINLAVLGRETGIQGTGRLLVVTTDAELSSDDLGIDARDALNNPVEVLFTQTTGAELPQAFELNGNFPNPFNPSTTIQFALPQAETVRLAIYSLDGRLVRTLVNEQREAGHHEVTWDGRDTAGRTVATGTYMYVIDAGRHHQTCKMSLIK